MNPTKYSKISLILWKLLDFGVSGIIPKKNQKQYITFAEIEKKEQKIQVTKTYISSLE